MALKVDVNLKSYPQGVMIGFRGLGAVENGGSLEVSEADEAAFLTATGRTVQEAFADQEGVDVIGTPSISAPVVEDVPDTESTFGGTPSGVEPSPQGGDE